MSPMLEYADHYQALGIAHDASVDDVRQAYKARLLVVHPDKTGALRVPTRGPGPESSSESAAALARIQEAYNVLKDPVSRAAYDELLRRQRIFEDAVDVYDELILSDMEPSTEGRRFTHPCRCGDFYTLDIGHRMGNPHEHGNIDDYDVERALDDTGAEYILECPSCSLHLLVREK